jgi:predicted permease
VPDTANLLLARATARQREIVVRLSIGAARGRIIRQLLTESALLAACGGVVGLVLAWGAGRLLLGVLSSGPQSVVFDLTPNWHVLAFTSAVAMATALAFGLAPAFRSTAIGPSSILKEDSRTGRSRLLSSLVVVEIALSLLLVIGAWLFTRTLGNLENVDPGFRRRGVLLVDLEGRRTAFPRELLRELQRLPGVVSASVSTHTPLSGAVWSEPAVPRGQAVPARDNAYFIGAGPQFFGSLDIRLLAGRGFSERDTAGSAPVAIVNEAYSQRYFRGANAAGQYLSAKVRGTAAELEIVGIAQNVDLAGLRRAAPPTIYVPYYQLRGDNFPTTLVMRVSGSLSKAAAAIRDHLQQRLPNVPIEVRPLSAQVEATLVQESSMARRATKPDENASFRSNGISSFDCVFRGAVASPACRRVWRPRPSAVDHRSLWPARVRRGARPGNRPPDGVGSAATRGNCDGTPEVSRPSSARNRTGNAGSLRCVANCLGQNLAHCFTGRIDVPTPWPLLLPQNNQRVQSGCPARR